MVNPKAENKRKPRQDLIAIRKNADLQYPVLKLIVSKGKLSPHDAIIHLKKSNQSVSRAFRKLFQNEMIGIVSTEPLVTGGLRKYYGLSDKGLHWLINNNQLELKEFWKVLFEFFDRNYKYRTKNGNVHHPIESINEVFNVYENILGISTVHFFFISDHHKEELNKLFIKGNEFYLKIKPIFEQIVYHETANIENDYTKIEMEMNQLIHHALNKKSKKIQYKLTPLGDLLLIKQFIDLPSTSEIMKNELSFKKKRFQSLLRKFELSYPMVFKNWYILKKILKKTDMELLFYFIFLWVTDKTQYIEQEIDFYHWSGKINPHVNEFDLLKLHEQMQNELRFKLRKFMDGGISYIKNWAMYNHCLRIVLNQRGFPSKAIKVYSLLASERPKTRIRIANFEDESRKHLSFIQMDEFFKQKRRERKKVDKKIDYRDHEINPVDLVYDEEDAEISPENFYQSFKNEAMPTNNTLKKVFNKLKPLEKFADLYNRSLVMDPETYSDPELLKYKKPDYFTSLCNMISFYFFMSLRFHISKEKWDCLMSEPEMAEVKNWFNNWTTAILNYQKSRLDEIYQHCI